MSLRNAYLLNGTLALAGAAMLVFGARDLLRVDVLARIARGEIAHP